MKLNVIIFCLLCALPVHADQLLKGRVLDENGEAMSGVSIFWEETQKGTTTDANGAFEIMRTARNSTLVVSFLGYHTERIQINEGGGSDLTIRLKVDSEQLNEVVVTSRRLGTTQLRGSVVQAQKMSREELFRAACCNLAESFETNPSVDVVYADASTGAKQIKLLGLSGTHVQMLTENYPNFRGTAALYGMDYIPGPWMESIQVSKGTSSVKNGYEALAGQINVEYKKPQFADMFSANLFVSEAQRYEGNVDLFLPVTDKWWTGLFVHYSNDTHQHDSNGDGFLDQPLKEQVNVMNRWQYVSDKYLSQYGIRYLHEDRTGGQSTKNNADPYRINLNTNRVELFTKQAYMLNPVTGANIAAILSGSYHEQRSTYDRLRYNIYQDNLYASLMYEHQFTDKHGLSAGLSLNYDGFHESLGDQKTIQEETVPGAYVEYTYNLNDKFIALAGIRADHSSHYGWFVTPRLHVKYKPVEWFHLRASIGKGFRTPHILAENNFLLASSRRMEIADQLDQEEAWNTGINATFYIPIAGKELTLQGEWYYTNFQKQVVIDMETDPHAVRFYNLDGKSFSHNYQIEATYPFFRGFTLTAAWRYLDVQNDYKDRAGNTIRLKKPLMSDYKAFATASYQTRLKKWQFDLTGQFNGGGRMPTPDPAQGLWEDTFGSYTVVNAQVTKYFRRWSVYLGVENLLDYQQTDPIIDAGNPRGDRFDGTMIWGPVMGRVIYGGFRWEIPKK